MKKILLALILLGFAAVAAQAGDTTITWYGQSAFKITTPLGKVVLIDPWVANPKNPNGQKDLEGLTKVDYILLTHAHGDHIGNSVEIAKKTGAKLVATFDLIKAMATYGGYPEGQGGMETTGHSGGKIALGDGEISVGFVPAVHGSGIEAVLGGAAPKSLQYGGMPGGFWIGIKGGPNIYHTGDTDLFGDMRYVPMFGAVDVMLACIGDKFTMGPDRGAEAVALVGPKTVIPMHFGTFPALTGTPEAFGEALKKAAPKVELKVLNPGESMKF